MLLENDCKCGVQIPQYYQPKDKRKLNNWRDTILVNIYFHLYTDIMEGRCKGIFGTKLDDTYCHRSSALATGISLTDFPTCLGF